MQLNVGVSPRLTGWHSQIIVVTRSLPGGRRRRGNLGSWDRAAGKNEEGKPVLHDQHLCEELPIAGTKTPELARRKPKVGSALLPISGTWGEPNYYLSTSPFKARRTVVPRI